MTRKQALSFARFVAAAALIAAIARLPSPAGAGRSDSRPPDKYRVVSERNIFLRDRRPPRVERPRDTRYRPSSAEPTVTSSAYRLVGVAFREGEYIAFLEDVRAGRVLLVLSGQAVGDGVVTGVGLDGIEYTSGQKITNVGIGEGLGVLTAGPPAPREGPPPTEPPATGGTTGSTTQPASQSPSPETKPATDSGTDDILERMRRRREQELK